jgi:phosphotransferase system enzyme I (PtsI)
VARELGIPAIVGVARAVEASELAAGGEIDGDRGEFRLGRPAAAVTASRAAGRMDLTGAPVTLMANVGSEAGAVTAARRGAHGIGLFRTEFLFLAGSAPVPAAEQARVYAAACEAMSPHLVVIRTLDAGSDKPLPYLPSAAEPNPALGRRGARLWLDAGELWRPQVEALAATAARWSNLRVMLPMVAAREEMEVARERFAAAASRSGGAVPPLGMMVEIPAVAVALEAFRGVADFISLGTNDLTQYAVAADRELEWGAHLSECNPGVLRLIAAALRSAARLGIPAGVCGEFAGRPEGAVFLAGAGASSLSMTADALPRVASVLRSFGAERCREAAEAALAADTAAAASAALRDLLSQAGADQPG